MLNKLFSLLKRIKITKEDNCINKLIEDNYNLNNNNQDLNEKIEKFFEDNCLLNQKIKDIEIKNYQVEEDNKKLINDNITLIKKIKDLKKQIENLSTYSTQ